jgi:hypothetical protein
VGAVEEVDARPVGGGGGGMVLSIGGGGGGMALWIGGSGMALLIGGGGGIVLLIGGGGMALFGGGGHGRELTGVSTLLPFDDGYETLVSVNGVLH